MTVKTNKIHEFQKKFEALRFESNQKTQANLKNKFHANYTLKFTIIQTTSNLEDLGMKHFKKCKKKQITNINFLILIDEIFYNKNTFDSLSYD